MIHSVAAWATENDIQDYSKAGPYYLRNFEERWKTWVPEKIFNKVKEALANEA